MHVNYSLRNTALDQLSQLRLHSEITGRDLKVGMTEFCPQSFCSFLGMGSVKTSTDVLTVKPGVKATA